MLDLPPRWLPSFLEKHNDPTSSDLFPMSSAWRRRLFGLLSAALLGGATMITLTGTGTTIFGSGAASAFGTAAMVRIGLVLGSIWLAWDSLQRPARWFPPGIAVAGMVGIVIIAAQPRLALAVVPLIGVLVFAGSIARAFRR